MRIPDIAARLIEISEAYEGMEELAELAAHLKRRSPRKRASPESVPMTVYLAKQIRAYARLHPDFSQKAIGEVFNVNAGRVSEATRGKRK